VGRLKDMGKKASKYDELLAAANGVSALWMEFRKHLRKSFGAQEIQMAEEQRFLEVKSELSRLQRFLAQKLPEGLQYGSKDVSEVMMASVSIGTVRDLPAVDKKNLYQRWHDCYIGLQRLLGVLDVLRDGYPVQFHTAKVRSSNVKESIGLVQRKKNPTKKVLTAAIVLIVIAAAAFFYMSSQ